MKKLYLLIVIAFSISGAMAQWSGDAAENLKLTGLTGEQVIPKIRLAPNGDYYLGYFSLENGNYNVRLQRLDNNGNKLWAEEGLLVSDHPSMTWLTDWDMTVDHENNAILTWQDIRMGGNNNIVAYKIAADGSFVWGADGIMLSNNAAFNVTPIVTVTASNNAVIAWMADNTLIRQKLSPSGEKLWGENGIVMSSSTIRYTWPQLMPVGTDDVLMKYYEDTGVSWAPTRHVYLQRFNSSGQGVWANAAVVSNAGSITAWTQILPFISDGNEGCYIAWHDYRLSGTISSGWIQHINNAGQPQFEANGAKIAQTDDYNKFYLQAAKPANDPNVYVFWNEVTGDQNYYGVYAQKISPAGERLWTDNGKVMIPVSSETVLPDYLMPVGDDLLFIYEHFFNGIETSIRARRYDALGNPVWSSTEVMVSSAQSTKGHMDAANFDGSQWVFAWEDDRSGDVDLFAQNLRPDGTLGAPTSSGTLSLTVTIEGNMAYVNEADIQIGNQIYHPNADGSFEMQLAAGTYNISVSHAYTETVTLEGIVITENVVTNQTVTLMMLRGDLQVKAQDQNGNLLTELVTYSVSGPEGTYNGTMSNGETILSSVPYGPYAGSASIEGGQSVEVNAIMDGTNQELIFVFIIDGVAEVMRAMEVALVPNPMEAGSVLHFNLKQAATLRLQLLDANGRLVGQTTIDASAGENSLHLHTYLHLQQMNAGVYTLRLITQQQQGTLKMVKTW